MENGQYGQMDINAILAQVDALYEADKGEEAEQLMLRSLEEAAGKREDGVRLQLLNELLGDKPVRDGSADSFRGNPAGEGDGAGGDDTLCHHAAEHCHCL